MNRIAPMIRNRISLHPPQEESLNILSFLCEKMTLIKSICLQEELDLLSALSPLSFQERGRG